MVSFALFLSLIRCAGCPTTVNALSTADCPRKGGTYITLIGNNFGPSSAKVIIGGSQCTNVTHYKPSP